MDEQIKAIIKQDANKFDSEEKFNLAIKVCLLIGVIAGVYLIYSNIKDFNDSTLNSNG